MRRTLLPALLAAVLATLIGIAATHTVSDASAAVCTTAQKSKATRVLTAFSRTMAANRRAYFRTHTGVKERRTFVKRQNATLKRLQAAARCQVRQSPPPPPAPPPPPPPPPAPGARATYVFGSEVTPAQQAILHDSLDLGVRFVRSALGRELPPFTVWGYTEVETLIRVYAETAPTTPQNSRDIWTRGTVATAGVRKLWFGPNWFTSGGPDSNLTKIGVHETFHILQWELAGAQSLNGGFDDIPRAGPRWISEGSAELVGYLAIANARRTSMPAVRADWAQRAKSSPATIQRLAILRGQFEAGSNAWGIMPLAVDRLVGEGGVAKVLSYFEAIGRGQPWEVAFSTVFGKSVDAFYAEFEAYRRAL